MLLGVRVDVGVNEEVCVGDSPDVMVCVGVFVREGVREGVWETVREDVPDADGVLVKLAVKLDVWLRVEVGEGVLEPVGVFVFDCVDAIDVCGRRRVRATKRAT